MELTKIILIPCQAGGYLAYYEKREDILANGETPNEVIENLKGLYDTVMEYEKNVTN